MIIYKCDNCGAKWITGINDEIHAAACLGRPEPTGMSDEDLQEIEDMLDGNDDKVCHCLREDARKLIAEVRRLSELLV